MQAVLRDSLRTGRCSSSGLDSFCHPNKHETKTLGRSTMNYFIPRGFWYGLYLFAIVAPLFVLLAGKPLPARGFWWEFSSALGFMSITTMGMEFALTARFKTATAPFGIDIVYYFHKYVDLLVCGLVVVHPAIIFLTQPTTISLLNPVTTPLRFKAGIMAALQRRVRQLAALAPGPGRRRHSCRNRARRRGGLLHAGAVETQFLGRTWSGVGLARPVYVDCKALPGAPEALCR
jgi:hypothetical protein